MNRLITSCFLFFSSLSVAYAQGQGSNPSLNGGDATKVITTAVPFLNFTPDARSAGMGDVGAATKPGVNAAFHNPGKLVYNKDQFGASVSYAPWLSKIINDMGVSNLTGYYKISKEQAVGLNLQYFDLGKMTLTNDGGAGIGAVTVGESRPRELSLTGTYSRKLSKNFGVGLSLKYIYSNLADQIDDLEAGHSVAADIGAYYTKNLMVGSKEADIAFGLSITNIGGKMDYNLGNGQKGFLPTNLKLGTAYTHYLDPFNTLTLAVDFNKLLVPSVSDSTTANKSVVSGIFSSFGDSNDELKEIMISTGLEYSYKEIFSARAGYFHEHKDKGNRKYITMGVGFKYQVFGADFAYLVPTEQEHPLAETLRVTLLFKFGESENQSSIKGD